VDFIAHWYIFIISIFFSSSEFFQLTAILIFKVSANLKSIQLSFVAYSKNGVVPNVTNKLADL